MLLQQKLLPVIGYDNPDMLPVQQQQYMSLSLIAAALLKKGAIKAPFYETRND
ncbi:hypothetical protein [Erwinia sp. HR93]|uniref:hypothetical protein n=1 Tax=Erwinia sp. HR93 TaxID=3094840 RepID=UPI002ADEE129|nr:hypothetical protein [Erwinia sp. HR93]MEA1062498.1 hypothetical protein [Erwinia sp. HR93]